MADLSDWSVSNDQATMLEGEISWSITGSEVASGDRSGCEGDQVISMAAGEAVLVLHGTGAFFLTWSSLSWRTK